MSGLPGKRGKMEERVSESRPVTPLKLTFGRSPTSTVETVRGEAGVRAMSLGCASGHGRVQSDGRRRALEVLRGSVEARWFGVIWNIYA